MPHRSPLRILYLVTSLEIGGAQTGLVRLANTLSPECFDLHVVAFVSGEKSVDNQFPSHVETDVLNVSGMSDVYKISNILNEIRSSDVLICSLYHATIVGRILGTIGNTPVVNWQHNEQFNSGGREWSYRLTNPLATEILADSDAVKEMLLDTFSIGSESVHVVPISGVDMGTYQPVESSSSDGLTTVGTLGTLTKQKNHETVIEVAKEFEGSDVEFTIAGKGPRRAELEKMAADVDNVRFEGYVEWPWEFLQDQDVYFQPSLYEGLCITVIEAMACGLPVVGSDVGEISNTVIPNETGYLASPRDVEAFVNYLQILTSNPKRQSEMGTAARKRVVDRYSAQSLHDNFCTVLNKYRESESP